MGRGPGIMAELSRGQILKNPEVLGSGSIGSKIRFLDGDESNYIDIKIPDSISTDYTFTFPDNPGTDNFFLKSDGSGNTSWGAVTAAPAGTNGQLQFNSNGVLSGSTVSTDGFNLFISSSAEVRFGDDDSSNYIALKSPSIVTTNNSYTLPDSVGSVGQALVIANVVGSNATLEWDAPSGGTTQNPGGDTDGSVQYNIGGIFSGSSAFKYNQSTNTLSIDNINSTSVTVDNINLDGNTIISTNTDGDINLNPNGVGKIRLLGGADLQLFDSDDSNFVGLTVPSSVTSNYTITLPAAGGVANSVLQLDGSQNGLFVSNVKTLNFVIDGGGSVITTGIKGHVVINTNFTVTGWTVIGDQSGSIVVDVKRATFTNFPTTTSIAGTEKPTLSSAQKAQDLTLTSWTTTLSADDVLEFVVDSVTTLERVTIALRLVPR
jgi:hypothetical protein